jgi:hypothetical protein
MQDEAPKRLPPGQAVAIVLAELPEAERGWMLAYFQQRAKREADLEVLRDLKAFREARDRKAS